MTPPAIITLAIIIGFFVFAAVVGTWAILQ